MKNDTIMDIQIIWHKNPDTDATLWAIITAKFLEKKWYSPKAYIQWELNKETEYFLQMYDIQKPEIKTELDTTIPVCLIDHNEASQAPDNFSDLDIIMVIDHHKIDFKSEKAIDIRIEPLCSTASILYKMYKEHGYEIEKETAIMMLGCMMSDSLLWKSPTTTQEDKKIAHELQEIAKIDSLEDFAMPMFEAKSDLWDMPVKDLIGYDYKNFEFGNTKIWVGTLETTNPGYGLWRKEEILIWLAEIKSEQNLDFIMLSIVDILWEQNTTITLDWSDSEVIRCVFGVEVTWNLSDLWARLSRKKQIVPDLTKYFQK